MDITYDDFDDLIKFLEMLLQMDCYVRVLFEESVRREDGMFEDMSDAPCTMARHRPPWPMAR